MSHEMNELELPDDLVALGEQLTREAALLSERYPPPRLDETKLVRRRADVPSGGSGVVPWLSAGIAVAGLIAVSLLGVQSPGVLPSADLAERTGATESVEIDSVSVDDTPSSVEREVFPVGIGLPADAPPPLSPPEWEAVLDLTPAEEWEGIELSL